MTGIGRRGMLPRALGMSLALVLLAPLPADAETFILASGERIEGECVMAIGSLVALKLPGRGMRQLAAASIQQVEITLADGRQVVGAWRGWSKAGYELAAGDQLLTVLAGRIVDEAPLAAPAGTASGAPAPDADAKPDAEPAASAADAASAGAPTLALADPGAAPSPAPAAALTVLTGQPVTVRENAGEVVFPLSLSPPPSKMVVLIYATVDQTALDTRDYLRTAGSLRIPAGSGSAELRVPLLDDDVAEAPERFEIFLSADPAAIRTERWLAATIEDDD